MPSIILNGHLRTALRQSLLLHFEEGRGIVSKPGLQWTLMQLSSLSTEVSFLYFKIRDPILGKQIQVNGFSYQLYTYLLDL